MCKNRNQTRPNMKWLLEHQIEVDGAGVIAWLRKEMRVTHDMAKVDASGYTEIVTFFFGPDDKWYVLKLCLFPVEGTGPRQISSWDLFVHYNQR